MFSAVLLQFFFNVSVEAVLCLEVVQFLVRSEYVSPLSESHLFRVFLADPEADPAHKEYPVKVYFEMFFLRLVVFFSFFFDVKHLPNAS